MLSASFLAGRATITWPAARDDVGVVSYALAVDGAPPTMFAGDVTSGDIPVMEGQALLVEVRAADAAGNRSPILSATITAPLVTPTWPSGAQLSGAPAARTVALSWTAAMDDVGVVSYDVKQDGVVVGSATERAFTVTGLQPETAYVFSVEAKDVDAHTSTTGPSLSVTTLLEFDPGFRRLTEEQFNRSLAAVHGRIWADAWMRAGSDMTWFRDEEAFFQIFTTQNYGYWRDYQLAYPEDRHQTPPGALRGGFRRHDQVVYDEHVTSWVGASMGVAGDMYEDWVGHAIIFGACERDNQNGVTTYANRDEVLTHCVDTFISEFGRLAFRRPLTAQEAATFRAVYDDSETAYPGETFMHWAGYGWRARGLRNLMAAITNSPEFLYRVELGDEAGNITAYELASRLSYHFWNTMPDEPLFAAAADGSLLTPTGYQAQVDRLAADARAKTVVDEFYRDFFRVQDIANVEAQSGPASYHGGPSYQTYGNALGDVQTAMRSELAELGMWFTRTAPGSYRDMFQSNLHFLKCVYPQHAPTECDGAGPYSEWAYGIPNLGGWDGMSMPIQLPQSERAGLVTRLALLGHDTAYARPIRRGLYIREALMCAPLPPPENCDVVKPPALDVHKTVREKVEAITEQPGTSCAGCHQQLINPFGHALGHFSSKGQFWPKEHMFTDQQMANGDYWYFLADEAAWRDVDTNADAWIGTQLVHINGAQELSNALVASGELEQCWSREYFRFTMGRLDDAADQPDINALATQMRAGMPLSDAFKATASLPSFKTLVRPPPAPASEIP